MSDFSICLRDQAPRSIQKLLKKEFEIHLDSPASFVHHLLISNYSLLSKIRLQTQSMQYRASAQEHAWGMKTVESLVLYEKEDESVVIEILVTNAYEETDIFNSKKPSKMLLHDADSTALALAQVFMQDEGYNVCAPQQSESLCLWLMACTGLLEKTHRFNVEVTPNSGFCFKAFSKECKTSVVVKTRAWTEMSMEYWSTQRPCRFSARLQMH